jgi:integrase
MHLRAKGASAGRVPQVKARLKRLFTECGFSRLADITPDKLTEWLVLQKGLGMSAATRNGYRVDAVSFCNWCRRTHRIEANPLLDVPTAKVNTDRRHIRRALAVEEVQRLITTAAIRTVAEYGRDRVKTKPEPGKAKRSNWTYAPLTPENIQAALRTGTATLQDRPELLHQLRRQGRERALIYKTLYLTGLRLNELRSIKLCQVELTRDGGFIHLRAQDEKNRQGNSIDVPRQLAADLRDWLDERLAELQQQQRMKVHESVPDRLPSDDPLFHIPTGLIRIIDRDLAAAGIAKLDERGHVFDIHAFRTTLNSHLAKQKIPQGVAQRIMRHSKPELTANHYTDMKYLDTAGAVSQLPIIDLNATVDAVARTVAATGTAGAVAPLLVPTLVPDGYKHSPFLSSADQPPGGSARTEALSRIAVSADSVKGKPPVTSAVTGGQEKRVKGVEPSTFTLATCIN